jgi:hypothetical protein
MKFVKKILVCFVAIFTLLFSLTACQNNKPTAEEAAKSIVLTQDKQSVSEDFQVPTIVVLEDVTFNISWVSDNPVARIADLDENFKKVVIDYENNTDAEQTVGLIATVTNGNDSFSKKFTFSVPKCEETGLFKGRVRTPEFGVEYLLGIPQAAKKEVYYFTGAMSGYYGATETDTNEGILVKLVETTGGFYITFEINGKTNYINGVKSGKHLNFVFSDKASSVYTWNQEYCTPVTSIEGTPVFMGTSDNYVTFGMMKTEELGKATVYQGTLYKKPANHGENTNQGEGNIQIDTTKVYTIEEVLEIGSKLSDGEMTTVRCQIKATVEAITDYTYGGMRLKDETGTISVYGSYSADGTLRYGEMESAPLANCEVLVSCILKNFKGTVEINSAWILEFEELKPNYNEADYTAMTIAEAREAAINTKVKLTGVVARVTFANGMKPSGFYLIDNTNSIYVYDSQLAPRVKEGDKITICANRVNWILDKEQESAAKFDYEGCIQVETAYLVGEIESNQNIDFSWVAESTVKEIMDTPVSNNITTTIYKVNAYVKKTPGDGFVNYYIDDIDGVTGSYTYTQCNGGDFGWLDEFDGKICTVYLSAINAKSNAAGCVWRFLPIKVVYENYTFDLENAAQYAITYHAKDQFLPEYTGNPEKELITSVSNEALGIEDVAISYSSSNTKSVYFTTVEGKTIFNVGETGTAVITISATHNSKTVTEEITISVKSNVVINGLTVEEAIAAPLEEKVVVKGIVGPSLVNKDGFYLMGDSAIIGVLTTKEVLTTIERGHYVIIEGVRKNYPGKNETFGQTLISDATIVANYYGNNEYNTSYFEEKTITELLELDPAVDFTTTVFKVTCSYNVYKTQFSSQPQLMDENGNYLSFYSSGAGQYQWLTDVMTNEDGTYKTGTFEVALCNWNTKNYYRGCVLSVTLEDGTTIYNNLNFNN